MTCFDTRKAALAGLLAVGSVAAQAGEGLHWSDPATLWPNWQARLTLTLTDPAFGNVNGGTRSLRQAALLGDRYLLTHGTDADARWRGGFRATSGLVAGGLGLAGNVSLAPWSTQLQSLAEPQGTEPKVLPYVGLGYSGLAPKFGFSVSADLGLVARQFSGASGLGRALVGQQGLESALRQLDLSPMVRLGLNYSF
jgi:hypothetical protein